ncbi:AAA family ATPase [Deltaproteobacteria bacterium IMCC39524]|nr:AAA family ATPase [Deltaproteobacteria bacterium IMCC39524]
MNYITAPKTTSDMVFANKGIENKLLDILCQNYPFPIKGGKNSLILYGVPGTGKSTYAEVFLNDFEKTFGGSNPAIHTTDCQKTKNITSILSTCNAIADKAGIFTCSGHHYFIFDEVDNLTTDGQKALKSFLNRTNIVCVLTTNYLHDINEGLKSRCVQLNFNAASEDDCVERFKKVLADNQLPILPDVALREIAKSNNGDWREMIPLLLWAATEYKKLMLAA